jgi:hypothetical protein
MSAQRGSKAVTLTARLSVIPKPHQLVEKHRTSNKSQQFRIILHEIALHEVANRRIVEPHNEILAALLSYGEVAI